MSRHADDRSPSTSSDPGLEALDRLRDRASQGSDPDEVLAQAEASAVALVWKAIYVAIALFALGITVVVVLGLYTIGINADVASFTSAEGVAANRQKAAGEVLGTPGQDCNPVLPVSVTFECLNRARAALGLAPVVPIEGLAPSQLGAALGEERGELRRLQAQRAGGALGSGSGVVVPDQGRFRGGR